MFIPNISCLAVSYLNASQMSNVTIVLLYAALLVIVTSIISLRTNDPDPMLAGRNMPWWLIAGSIVGTSISSIAFLAIPTKGFSLDFNFLIGKLTEHAIGLPIALIFFVGFLRKTRDASIYTMLGDRFGKWASVGASVAFILYSIIRMGVITALVAQAINLICGANVITVILLTGAIVIFYTYMSGIEGVMWTDLFQTIILVVAGLSSVYFLTKGISTGGEALPGSGTANWGQLLAGASIKFDLKTFLPMACFLAVERTYDYTASQCMAQRYLVARTEGHAKAGLLVGGLLIPVVVGLFFVIGVLLYNFYQMQLPGLVDTIRSADGVFAHFIAHQFPDGLKGLAVIGILAAAMSSIDTGINSSSTVLICNLYEPYSKAPELKKALLTSQILRTSSVAFGVLGILAACIVYLSGECAFDMLWKGIGVVIPGIFGLFLLMRMSKKAGPKAAMAGGAVGLGLAIWMIATEGLDHLLASPFHYMWAMPASVMATVFVGWVASYFIKEKVAIQQGIQIHLSTARSQVAQKRKRTKKNIFADSLRPKMLYRIYAAMAIVVAALLYIEGKRFSFIEMDYRLVMSAIFSLLLVAIGPFFIENVYNKRYASFYLTLLGFSLPFIGAIALFSRPDEPFGGYFYLLTVAVLGTMVGWTMLGLITMVSTAVAAQVAGFLYPQIGIPDNWAMIAIGVLGTFTYYAFAAARDNMVSERTLTSVHNILEKLYARTMDVGQQFGIATRPPNFKEIARLGKVPGDMKATLKSLIGATDMNPEEIRMELSVKESLAHTMERCSSKAKAAFQLNGDADFNVLGSREVFENILFHVLDNAFYYVERGEASRVICTLDAAKKTLSIANNGPTIKPANMPYIFDLGYGAGKDSLGLGLTYCKKMLEGMRSGIRLISKPNDPWVQFCLYFPKYAQLPSEAQRYGLDDNEDDTNLHHHANPDALQKHLSIDESILKLPDRHRFGHN